MHGRRPNLSRSPYEGAGNRLKRGGLGLTARISLMEGVLPSMLWQPESSWSRSEGMHGRMREHGAPAMDQGCGEGVAQDGWGLWSGPEASGRWPLHPISTPRITSRHRRSSRSSG